MNTYPDGQSRELAKWAHDRVLREREERVAVERDKLLDIYEGYYPEDY